MVWLEIEGGTPSQASMRTLYALQSA